jgi:hypothetical protein
VNNIPNALYYDYASQRFTGKLAPIRCWPDLYGKGWRDVLIGKLGSMRAAGLMRSRMTSHPSPRLPISARKGSFSALYGPKDAPLAV